MISLNKCRISIDMRISMEGGSAGNPEARVVEGTFARVSPYFNKDYLSRQGCQKRQGGGGVSIQTDRQTDRYSLSLFYWQLRQLC